MRKTFFSLCLMSILIPCLSFAGIYVDNGGGGSIPTSTIENGSVTGQLAYWDSVELKWIPIPSNRALYDVVNERLQALNGMDAWGILIKNNNGIAFENATETDYFNIQLDPYQTNQTATITVPASSNRLLIFQIGDFGNNFALPNPGYPIVSILGANAPVDPSQRIDIGFDGTQGVIDTGGTRLKIPDPVTTTFLGITDSSDSFYSLLATLANNGQLIGLSSTPGEANYNLILTTLSNLSKDHGHSTPSPDPSLIGHSSTNVDTKKTEFWKITHDKTAMVISTGEGNVKLKPADGYSVEIDSARLLTDQGANVVSANDITLGNGNFFHISGSVPINTIINTGWKSGTEITLQVDDGTTLFHNVAGAGASLRLQQGNDCILAAGGKIKLQFDGTYWSEQFRIVF